MVPHQAFPMSWQECHHEELWEAGHFFWCDGLWRGFVQGIGKGVFIKGNMERDDAASSRNI